MIAYYLVINCILIIVIIIINRFWYSYDIF